MTEHRIEVIIFFSESIDLILYMYECNYQYMYNHFECKLFIE